MPHEPAYADLEIRILERQSTGHPVEFTLNDEQEFQRGYLDPAFLPWQPSSNPEHDGERLFNWLCGSEAIKITWATVRSAHPQCRIRLRIDTAAPELHAIPWELLREVRNNQISQTIATTMTTPFSRYLAGVWQPGHPILKRPIRILVVIPNPQNLVEAGLEPFDVEQEWQTLQVALAELVTAGTVTITRLAQPCSLVALEAELKAGYHILHFIGHGGFNKEDGTALLVMANAINQVEFVHDKDFAAMLARQLADTDRQRDDKLRLVYLDSCETATRDATDAMRGFAPALIKAGVPAVIAMQDRIAVSTGQAFSRAFYRQLLEHGQVDLACNEARAAVLTAQLPGAEIPVLFMRLRSGLLFGRRGQIIGDRAESFWNTLLDNIEDGECTPFLGPGVTADLLPNPEEVAYTLAAENNYPFANSDSLPHVAQFIGTVDNRRLRKELLRILATGFKARLGLKSAPEDRRRGLVEIITASDWSTRSQERLESELHHQLAELALPLYITTNLDNCMALALQATGRPARQITIPWREPVQAQARRPHYDLEPPPSPEQPVIVHLFGTEEDLLSLVLTEDDYLDYLARIARDYEYLLPTSVHEALASTTLLFLGYRLEDLDLKVIMRGLLTHLDLARWGMLHVAVQIEADDVDAAKNQEIVRYFQKYFSTSKIDLYWGSTRQFMADLYARWQERQHG